MAWVGCLAPTLFFPGSRNLADGSTLTAGRNKLLVSYTGGDGNDLTQTVR